MTITTNPTDRKALAKAIAEELGTTARYLGLPSYGYQIGDFTVDHDFPDAKRLRASGSGSARRGTA